MDQKGRRFSSFIAILEILFEHHKCDAFDMDRLITVHLTESLLKELGVFSRLSLSPSQLTEASVLLI